MPYLLTSNLIPIPRIALLLTLVCCRNTCLSTWRCAQFPIKAAYVSPRTALYIINVMLLGLLPPPQYALDDFSGSDVRGTCISHAVEGGLLLPAVLGVPMVLLIAIIVGVAVFCFLHGYTVAGIVCLFGFSKRYGWPALLITSLFLFWHRQWFVALLPPLLIMWNVWGLRYVGAPVSSVALISTMKQQAASGNPLVQYSLGGLYFDGLSVPQNYAQAALWYRKAAEQGVAGAQYKLGVLYCYGRGVPQDDTQAALWWRKATEQADAVAQDRHGSAAFMLMVLGVPDDYAEAYFWLDLAAAGKLVDAEQGAKYRDEAASHLSLADLARVQERARKWVEAHQAKPTNDGKRRKGYCELEGDAK